MSEFCGDGCEVAISAVVEEQIQLFLGSELINPLRSREILLGSVALSCVTSPSLYRGVSAKILDNPKTDTMSVFVDMPTISDLLEEFATEDGMSEEDVMRLHVGTGIANLLLLNSPGMSRPSRMIKFVEALSEPQGLYASTMESPIFDRTQADSTASAIASEGDAQTARVNAQRLKAGMFVEAQPEPKEIRSKLQKTFQEGLDAVFDGKEIYIKTVELFDVTEKDAEDMYSNSVETLMGLSFPMEKPEIKDFIKILR